MIGYLGGYRGLLKGESVAVTKEVRAGASVLQKHGGSPIGNSRVKLTNVADAVKRGLVKEGQLPLQVAAEQLTKDGITILHTIGGDDTSTTAADLAKFLADNGYDADRRRAAENGRQRHRADPPVDGRDDRRRAGRDLFRERRQRRDREPAHASDPRGDGAQLRLAHRRDRARL